MTKIEFFVAGIPKAQPRPQVVPIMRDGRVVMKGGRPILRAYTPNTADGWKQCIRMYARPHVPQTPIEGAIRLHLGFLMPRPKSHYGTGKRADVLRDSAPLYHTSKPDFDNLEKAVVDTLTELAFWVDDGQICRCRTSKLYPAPGVDCGVHIRIESEIQ